MAIQLDHFLILSVVIFIYAIDVAFGAFSYNLSVFFSVSCMWLTDEKARVIHIERL